MREDEDSTPLPGGVRLVDTVPAADGLLFLTDVLLTNTGDERVEVAVVGHAGGREQARATVAVPAGERRQMALTPSPDDPFRGASHVVVHASDAVVVTTLLRHTFGHTARKAQSSTARRTVWRGEADGVGGMLLTLVNPGERPVTADVRLQCGDEVVQRRRVTVAPGERATVRLHTAGLEGVLTLTAEGEGLTRSLLRWGEQDPWVR